MAKTIKNRTLSEASTSKGRKVSTSSIVTPTKTVKKGKWKEPAKKKSRKTESSLSMRQLSSLPPLLSSSSLHPSTAPSSSLPLLLTTAQSFLNVTTPKKKKTNQAHSKPGLLQRMSSHQLKTDNFEVSSKIKLQHYEIDWFNPEVVCSECIKYLKSKDSLPNNHASQLKFLMEAFEPAQIKISFSNAIGNIGNTATKLYYPLPMRKDKIVSSFIELILSTMMYSRRKTAM